VLTYVSVALSRTVTGKDWLINVGSVFLVDRIGQFFSFISPSRNFMTYRCVHCCNLSKEESAGGSSTAGSYPT